MTSPDRLEESIRSRILAEMDLSSTVADDRLLEQIREAVCDLGRTESLSTKQRLEIERHVYNALRKYDVLQDLLEDDEITEIMVNGPNRIFVEKAGHIFRWEHGFSSAEKLNDVIQQIVAANNRLANESNPISDTRLPDGSRVHIVLPPIAVDGSILTIRRFPKEAITMQKLIDYGSVSQEIADFLRPLVECGYNIFVSGGTGSGKTTFLNALTEFIPEDQRVITIEDSAELQLIGLDNLVRLEAREANLEGKLAVSIRDLVKASLRMRPDRIIVGECRGPEALEVLQANNTGHDGSMSTGHANSAKDMISRLETMVLMAMDLPLAAVRGQIAGGIDLFIHLGRLPDGSRKLLEIAEVMGIRNDRVELQTLYSYEGEGIWEKKNELKNLQKLRLRGIGKG